MSRLSTIRIVTSKIRRGISHYLLIYIRPLKHAALSTQPGTNEVTGHKLKLMSTSQEASNMTAVPIPFPFCAACCCCLLITVLPALRCLKSHTSPSLRSPAATAMVSSQRNSVAAATAILWLLLLQIFHCAIAAGVLNNVGNGSTSLEPPAIGREHRHPVKLLHLRPLVTYAGTRSLLGLTFPHRHQCSHVCRICQI